MLDWKKSPLFFREWNSKFTVATMNGDTENFRIILASDCADDISDCLNNGGGLNGSVTRLTTLNVGLEYKDSVNGEPFTIELSNSATYNLGENVETLRGVFLTNVGGFVLGYCIFNNHFQITDSITFEEGLRFWSESNTEGEV